MGAGGQDALGDEGADLLDDGHLAGPPALGALVGQPAGRGCGLTAHGPDPLGGVDVSDAAAGDLSDPCGGARGEDGQGIAAVHEDNPWLTLVLGVLTAVFAVFVYGWWYAGPSAARPRRWPGGGPGPRSAWGR